MPAQHKSLFGLSVLTLAAAAITAGCAGIGKFVEKPAEKQNPPTNVTEIHPGVLAGYLSSQAPPNSLALLPAPPAVDTPAFVLDEEISYKSVAIRGTPRWELAAKDADLMFPHAAGTFSCALNAPVTEQDTPHLYRLLRRSLADAGQATYTAQNRYQRARPFAMNRQPTCSPNEEKFLATDGSYPSGHAAIGWAWALILAEISPEQTDAILARGLAFGQSSLICNIHWHSDVEAGRTLGAGTVARLHGDPAFRADLETAKAELAAVRSKRLKPSWDCAAEAAALAQ